MAIVGVRPVPADSPAVSADEAIAALYLAHWAPMVRLAYLLVRDQYVAEEVVQDSLINLHRRWSRLRNREDLVAYLRRAVVNGSRSVLRHDRVRAAWLAREQAERSAAGVWDAPSAEATALAHHQHDAMMAALAALPRRQREVLVLRYYLDLTEAQIAQTLDISTGSVKAHAHRGLAALRDRMPVEGARR